MVTVQTRQLGRRRPLLDDWSFELPPAWGEAGGEPLTLRRLITKIVCLEVTKFRERQKRRATFHVMTVQEVA
ncbi:MAG: hypothetical protein HY706_19820 [Candidatus Hydrogenedentes bacterium]|nr:hypothetical protein [Candidatus Hydrogenedentota bacterium]